MAKVLVAGGTGFIGNALAQHWKDRHEVVVMSRSGDSVPGAVRGVRWDGESLSEWASEVEGAAVVINLSGASISKSWTPEHKKLIRDSRVRSTAAICEAIKAAANPPSLWINSSAVGYYGDTRDVEVDESSPPGTGFLSETAVAWEAGIERCDAPTTRKVWLRTGLPLSPSGGALKPLANVTKWFLGGSAGGGNQYMSWIHLRDLLRIFDFLIDQQTIAGPVNATSPNPLKNNEFMAQLRQVLGRPWSPPAPSFALKALGAIGGPEASLLLTGQRVVPRVLLDSGFEFEFPLLKPALEDLLKRA
jgi:uncharacterized protein